MRATNPFRSLLKIGGALLTMAGMLLGAGAHGASASAPGIPRLTSVESETPTTILLRWQPPAGVVDGFRINLYKDGSQIGYANAPAKGSTGAYEVYNLKPETRYCVGLLSYTGSGVNGASVFSQESDRLCVIMKPLPPPAPDLTVTRITGQDSLRAGESSVYEVVMANLGGLTTKGSFLNIRVVDGLELVGMSGTPAGFECAITTTKYEPEGFMRCTGQLAGVEAHPSLRVAIFQVRVRGVSAGASELNAYAGAVDDADGSNATRTLDVTVR